MSLSMTDKPSAAIGGYVPLALAFASLIIGILALAAAFTGEFQHGAAFIAKLVTGIVFLVAFLLALIGIYVLQPNESAVLILFGDYAGTDDRTGLRWANPFFAKRRVSRRLQTHHIETIKVNDASGNPIEIGAAIVWHVFDAAKALLEVDDYRTYVAMQSETALRKIASSHPYDHWQDIRDDATVSADIVSLRDGAEEITESLIGELRGRFARTGIEVTDARITHLAYAPEIASAMLRRQQANAIVSARRTIVKGAVELVKEALTGLKDRSIEIDDVRQAAMVSNMLIVLVGDKDATPVINTGILQG